MSTAIVAVNYEQAEVRIMARAEAVRQRIEAIKADIVDRSLELGRLLVEAREQNYPAIWGYSRFGDWVENASGLDMSERQAYSLMNVVERSELLGITDEQLRKVKISKLKEIFSLKAAEPEVVRELVEKAETASLDEIRLDVQKVKVADGAEPFTHISFRIPLSIREYLLPQAFAKARLLYGSVEMDGEVLELPDWKALELCLSEMLNKDKKMRCPSCGTVMEPEIEAVQDAEYEDVIEVENEAELRERMG